MVDKEKVKEVLEKIRPQLQMDGGDVELPMMASLKWDYKGTALDVLTHNKPYNLGSSELSNNSYLKLFG